MDIPIVFAFSAGFAAAFNHANRVMLAFYVQKASMTLGYRTLFTLRTNPQAGQNPMPD